MLNQNLKAWVVCLSAALFFFFVFIQMTFIPSVAPLVFKKFNVGASGLASFSSMYFWGNLLFLFPAGLILDRVSTKLVLLTVMAISIAATLVFGWADSMWVADVSRFLMGAVGAFCLLAPVRLASRWFPPEKMALVVGVIVTMAMIGGMVAHAPFQMLVDSQGLLRAIYFDVVLGVVIWLLILWLVAEAPDLNREGDAHTSSTKGIFRSIFEVLKVKQNWFAGVYASLVNLPIFLLGGFAGGMYLVQVHGLTRTHASFVNGMLFFGMIFGSPAYGFLSDKFRQRRMPMIVGAVLSLALFLVIMFSPSHNVTGLSVLFFLFGFAISSQVISYPLVVESNSLQLTGTAEGLASFWIMAGGLTQNVFAWMLNFRGGHTVSAGEPIYSAASYHFAFSLMLGAFILAFFISLMIRETHCKMLEVD